MKIELLKLIYLLKVVNYLIFMSFKHLLISHLQLKNNWYFYSLIFP
jgi:hypothetical protein